jgi:hypothetical protein
MICVVVAGTLTRRRASTTVAGLILGSVVAAGVASIVFLFWFASGDCGD